MKCINCGCKFDREEAEYQFETEYDGLIYGLEVKGLCGDCAIERMHDIITSQEGYYEEELSDSPDIPEGCAACGGNYPHCVDSCPLFDN